MQGSVQEVGSVHWVCHGAGGEQRDEWDATTKYLRSDAASTKRVQEYKFSAARLCVPCPTRKHCTRDRARGEIQVLLYSFMTS